MKFLWKKAIYWLNVYDDTNPAAANDGGTNDGGTGDGSQDPPPSDGGSGGDDKPKFTQAQLNKLLAEDKRKHQKQVEKHVSELEQFKKSKNLSDKERESLASRIEELNNSLLTKDQLAAKEKEKLQSEYKRERETLATERDFYRNLFSQSTITRSIMDEAIKSEAYNPQQIVTLLQGSTRLVEVLDGDGNPVPGQYQAKIKMSDTDKEGKPTTLDLTVSEALKRMRDRPDEFGNLFKSGLAGGLGGSSNRPNGKNVDPAKMTPEQFRKWRKERGY